MILRLVLALFLLAVPWAFAAPQKDSLAFTQEGWVQIETDSLPELYALCGFEAHGLIGCTRWWPTPEDRKVCVMVILRGEAKWLDRWGQTTLEHERKHCVMGYFHE